MYKQKIIDPILSAQVPHKYLGMFGMIWVSLLIISSLTSQKTFFLYGITYSTSILAYPFVYIFNDIFTEVYGYRVSRKVVWTGFFCFFLVSFLGYLYSYIPAPESFKDNYSFDLIFRASPLVALTSLFSFSTGEFINSYILAKMKIWTNGKYAEARYILSTAFGQFFDNGIFTLGTFLLVGWYSSGEIISIVLSSAIFATVWEMLAIPVTRRVIKWIKEQEGIDTYDVGTDFNPLKI